MAELQQDGVSDGLSGQGCPCCSESDGHVVLGSNGNDSCDLFLIVNLDNHLGVEPVEGSVCAVSKGPH